MGEEEFILLSRECGGKEIISLLNENIVADEVEFVDESMKWEWITVWTENNETSKAISDYPPSTQVNSLITKKDMFLRIFVFQKILMDI